MFGIGLPEMILILALALIVVGPDKLPELARSLAKGVMELKKTAEGFKEALGEDSNPLAETKKDLEEAAQSLQKNLLGTPNFKSGTDTKLQDTSSMGAASSAYAELMKNKGAAPVDTSNFIEIESDDAPVAEPEIATSQTEASKSTPVQTAQEK